MQRVQSADQFHTARNRQGLEPPPILKDLVGKAGVRFNGDAPWDIQVHDAEMYRRVLARGSLGFGEAYMDGLWDAVSLDELFCRLLRADIDRAVETRHRLQLCWEILRSQLINLQSPRRAFQVAERHYDIGNDIFEAMLDPSMNYSCAYWAHADTLEQAQLNKLDLICRKLQLKPGERLLDIGCGWGGLAQYAASRFDVEVYGITVSKEQQRLARERCVGLPVTIELMDYRKLAGQYDKAVSVGMFEHVGPKNYRTYFSAVARVLKDEGLFLLQTIGNHADSPRVDPWIARYIFPNGKLPSAGEISRALENLFLIEDWQNLGLDYDRTLMAWWDRFERAWPRLRTKYVEGFYRMWKYYLHSCAGFFRSRHGQLWQLVLSKPQRAEIYRRPLC